MSWTRRTSAIAAICAASVALASVANAAPRLLLSTNNLLPVLVPGDVGTQTVEAFNAGDGVLNLSVTTSAAWLRAVTGAPRPCKFRTGGTCIPIDIALNAATLANGTYTEYVLVKSAGALDAPQEVSVTAIAAGIPGNVSLYAAPDGGAASIQIYPHGTIAGKVSTQSGGNWLSLQTPAGTPPFTFGSAWSIQAATQPGQAPGVYAGTIAVSGSSYQPDNRTISVTLNVTASPIIRLNNSVLHLTGFQGGPRLTAIMSFTNAGLGSLVVSGADATSTPAFLSVVATGATIIFVTADPQQLAPGFYFGQITIHSNAANNAAVAIPIEMNILPAEQPAAPTSRPLNAIP